MDENRELLAENHRLMDINQRFCEKINVYFTFKNHQSISTLQDSKVFVNITLIYHNFNLLKM